MTKTKNPMNRGRMLAIALCLFPALTGATQCGGQGLDAPEIDGKWALSYNDKIDVEIKLGGAVYKETLGANGGSITINHEGQPITFDLDCARPEVVCPSEVWPATVDMEQRNDNYPRRVWVRIPTQSCDGQLVAPQPGDCGEGSSNPDCDDVCDGEVKQGTADRFGMINDDGSRLDVLLGAGIASNGFNCAMLGLSAASTELVTSGGSEQSDWTVDELSSGKVAVGYAGGCLWAGDPDSDGKLEALVIGASIEISTGFTGSRAD